MELDPSNLLGTPQGYATPDQIRAIQEYAKALGSGSGQQPVITHPLQGVSNVVSALVGGALSNRAAGMERGARQFDSSNMPMAPQQQGQGIAPPQGAGGTDAKAISGIESGGKYDLLGPVTKTGDRAYGRYQVMGQNVGPWTKEVLGQQMTPEEFLANPKAQDAVFQAKFGQYKDKYGPSGAARAWFAGEGGMNNPKAKDMLGTTVAGYEDKFNKAAGVSPTGPMQFQGAGGQEPPALAAITSALAGGAKTQQPPTPALQQPQPQGQFIQPGLTPLRPQVNRQQFENIMSSSWLPPEMKKEIMDLYMQQNQPQSVPFVGGNVLTSPTGQQQQYIPGIQQMPTEVSGGAGTNVKTNLPSIIQPTPGGGYQLNPIPWGQPPGAPPGAGGAGGMPPIPPAPQTAPPGTASPPPGLPNLLHYAPDEGATPQPAPGAPQGALSMPPGGLPPFAPNAAAQPPAPPVGPGAGPGGQTAQFIPPQVKGMLGEMRDFGLDTSQQQEQRKQMVEKYAKAYDDRSHAAEVATRSIPNIQLAKKLTEDPTFISGFLADPRLDLARAKAFLSDYANTNPNAAAATEMFDKLMSGNIVEDMKVMLQGLGQVRVAEINLLSKATGNRYNTIPANRAVLDVMLRTHQMASNLGQMASAYANGVRWNPKTGEAYQAVNHPTGLDYGWDTVLQQYIKNHPLFSDDEIKNYNKTFDLSQSAPSEGAKKYGGIEGIEKTLTNSVHGATQTAQPAPKDYKSMSDDELRKALGLSGK